MGQIAPLANCNRSGTCAQSSKRQERERKTKNNVVHKHHPVDWHELCRGSKISPKSETLARRCIQPYHIGRDIDDDDTNTLELTEKLTAEQSSTNTSFVGDLPEAEPLWYLAQTAHRPLFSHPVITSFLCLKWRRIRTYYYANLFFYTIFLSLLTSY